MATPSHLKPEWQIDYNHFKKNLGFSDSQIAFLKEHKAWQLPQSNKIYVSDFNRPTSNGYYDHRWKFDKRSGAANYKSPWKALSRYSLEDWGLDDPNLSKYYNLGKGKDIDWWRQHWNEGVHLNKVTGKIMHTPKKYKGYWMRSSESTGEYTLAERVFLGMDMKRKLRGRQLKPTDPGWRPERIMAQGGGWNSPWWIEGVENKKNWRDKNIKQMKNVRGKQVPITYNAVAGRWKSKSQWGVKRTLPWVSFAANREDTDIDYSFYERQKNYQDAMNALGMRSFSLPRHLLAAEDYMHKLRQNPQYKSPYQMQIEDLYEQLNNLQVSTGQVTGLDSKIEDISQGLLADYAKTGDVSTQLGGYLKTGDFNQSMRDNLQALGVTLQGDAIKNIGGLDINKVMSDIQSQGGDISALTGQFSGLQDEVGIMGQLGETERKKLKEQLQDYQTQGGQDLAAMEAKLMKDYGDKITGLDTTFGSQLGDVKKQLGTELAGISGDVTSLGGDLSSLQQGFAAQKASTAGKFGDIQDKFEQQLSGLGTDFKTQLADTQKSTAADILGVKGQLSGDIGKVKGQLSGDIAGVKQDLTSGLGGLSSDIAGVKGSLTSGLSDVYTSRDKALAGLDETWAGKLKQQEDAMQGEIAQASQAFNDRLTKLSSSMSYRMLGDSAGGVRMRRSKAYKSGSSSRGTGQLGRSSMRIQGLNV